MADQKISQLTAKDSLASTDVLTILDSQASNTNKKILASTIEDLVANSGTAPISVTNKVISIATADTSTTGALSSTDWNTFNNKQATMTAETPISIVNNEIQCAIASDTTDGYLLSDDWNDFNEKQDTQFVQTSPSSPLTVSANTCYKFASSITSLEISNFVTDPSDIEIQFTTGATFTFTASSWATHWVGGAPAFSANTAYVIALKNGVAVLGEIA